VGVRPSAQEVDLRHLIDAISDHAVFMLGTEGRILTWNLGAERLYGYSGGAVVGEPFEILFSASEREQGHPARVLAEAAAQGRCAYQGTKRRADGTTFHAAVVINAIRSEGGGLDGFAKVTRDVSDYVRTVEELRDKAELIDAMMNAMVDSVVLIDETGIIRRANGATERIFGYAQAELVGRNVKMLMPEEIAARHDAIIADYLRTGVARIIGIGREVEGRRKDGTFFPIDLAVGEVVQNRQRMFIGTMRDISERRTLEAQFRQAQKMEIVGQISGGIAHDFNNMLTVIFGNLELVLEGGRMSAQDQKNLEVVQQAAEKAARLTSQLVAFSRRQPLAPQDIDCQQLLQGVERLLQRVMPADVVVTVHPAQKLWKAFVDPVQLESAILNLALNARDAMPDGGALTIESANAVLDEAYAGRQTEVAPGPYVMIAVTDTGTGMPHEVVARAFEPFFTTKGVGKGSGLGLSMVHGFVKQSRGHVQIYSEVGQGTTIKLYLPRAAGEADDAQVEMGGLDRPETGRATILLVEDEPEVRAFSADQLRSLGYRVFDAANGDEAMMLMQKGLAPDLLFTDVVLTGSMNGRQLAAEVCKLRARTKVLFTSGYPVAALVHNGRLDEGVELLLKPYRRRELAARIAELLAGTR